MTPFGSSPPINISISTMDGRETPPSLAHFGPLVNIQDEDLVKLAIRIRKDILKKDTSEGKLLQRIDGEYNLIHILQLDDFKLVIRVSATGHGPGLTSNATNALKATVGTLRFLEKKTTIPVPRVYDFDTTKDNEIKAPYICMSFIEGESLQKAWHDVSREVPLEERRLKVLTSIAEATAQLAPFKFDKIGSFIESKDGEFTIGPSYQLSCDVDGVVIALPVGPYESWSDYLKEHLEPSEMSEANDFWAKGKMKMIKAMLSYMPCADDTDGFVLSLPDTENSNFLVDSQGNLTGIIDWDGALVLPACIGYGSYPSFIMRDWDPIWYQLPALHLEASIPIKPENYRASYNTAMKTALNGHEDWKWVAKSHIRQAVFLAAIDENCRRDVCRRFIEEVTGSADARLEVYHIGQGLYDGLEWGELEIGLEQLIRDN